MKRYSLIICMVLILSLPGVASAQIVLGPPADTGTPGTRITYTVSYTYTNSNTFTWGPYGPYPGTWTGTLAVGKYIGYTGGFPYAKYYLYDGQGAIEFDLQGGTTPLPTVSMTANNFTAKLDGLNVDSSSQFGNTGAINVDLFDMGDGTEDGIVDLNDYNSRRGDRIARLAHDFAGTDADFTDIDVTCAVRNDLFGAVVQTDFSGFILKSPDADYVEIIYYDDDPTLTINPGVPGPKCASGGGGGGCFIANAAR